MDPYCTPMPVDIIMDKAFMDRSTHDRSDSNLKTRDTVYRARLALKDRSGPFIHFYTFIKLFIHLFYFL